MKVTLHGNSFQALESNDANMTLHLCTGSVTISSKGPPNLSYCFFLRIFYLSLENIATGRARLIRTRLIQSFFEIFARSLSFYV